MKRVITALVLIPTITYVIAFAPLAVFLSVLAAVAFLCFLEYSGIVAANGVAKPGIAGFVLGFIVLLSPWGGTGLIAGVALVALAMTLRAPDLRTALARSGALALGVAYIFGAWHCAYQLRLISPWWLLFAIALNWVGDTAAMYAGRTMGRHKLAPRISPGKTWEGAVASVLASVVFGVILVCYAIPGAPLWIAALIAMLANIAGQIGDLCESVLKRGAGMKDSGTLLPGHGGWLDRVDSTLFAVPVAYGLLELARFTGYFGK